MSIHYPPQYRYSLYTEWDKEAFSLLSKIGKSKKYPQVLGTSTDINQLLIIIIRTQKALHDWRDILKDILQQVKEKNIIDAVALNSKYPSESIGKDIPAWVTYPGDEIVNNFIDHLEKVNITFHGSNEEIAEFILRFILGQLGHDWEQTIMMIWEMLGEDNSLFIDKLNKEMKNFDYLGIFE
ncbi:hypothetical protein A3H80_02200 [Candidatus Roizmanbacteria bacterium RIFCSPLOWO2_02_FULL_37_19]|uniref:Uncharacterized protein n=1 Tax=Candidatus Roizmanbacteria bacterium RIFCSPHIGHO2_02_FULL_37_24 TaxID=1802037 RepID=A0A1F7H0B0_9BACT|nr:MAG: hypothetical protein A2862_02785 [Candidatus Roizmanbacteria bacterium RIFCSPHIGHO2_01_FULL_38_41]OGK24545.1 MAG: hypothetical protein A3C24_03280 [Candidatus Roizmanbacteria bacterium RIFCSPHIGHO2_02_FULL_37_24]OGK31999.1 MAG: hypothetical protein A3E10_04620 [Candidatus Roizmanbacteria bacterium RIFCSPHIGHO2_12_FULL_37_23]OGK43800.1 MAG: hypothetical protein A2956_04745 [Candidatus Roizmanbacteria bacterium RIFCSPLOWO2_01_FULL_37_57]OGK54354.1 MAG: hypothetical protein A3H80_02200 [Ca